MTRGQIVRDERVELRRRRRSRAGVTLAELAIAMPILLVAVSMFSSTLVAMFEQRAVNRESFQASQTVQSTLERIRNERVEDILALYNNDPLDDPLGPGTAPGAGFDIDGLVPLVDDPDGRVGEIILPLVDGADPGDPPLWQLREDADWPELGLPRDLNRDHVLDELDHSGDYSILPVIVRARWQGTFGPREMSIFTIYTRYRIVDR